MLCFGILARKWPELMRRWESVEAKLPKFRTQQEQRGLAFHMKMLALVVLFCSLGKSLTGLHQKYELIFYKFILVEHILSMYSFLYYSMNCLEQNDPLNELLKTTLPELFSLVEYSTWLAILGKFLNVSSTFAWNYMDLFVMLISLGLSSRFKQINDDLQRVKGAVILVFFFMFLSI